MFLFIFPKGCVEVFQLTQQENSFWEKLKKNKSLKEKNKNRKLNQKSFFFGK